MILTSSFNCTFGFQSNFSWALEAFPINKLTSGRTVITIAHKLNNFQQSSNIAVMNKGEITEYGSHDHLINLNGIYKKIYELQTTK